MAHKILYAWHTRCSACGGNADPTESRHIHGGPDSVDYTLGSKWSNARPLGASSLDKTNGCRARFNEPDVWGEVLYTHPGEGKE